MKGGRLLLGTAVASVYVFLMLPIAIVVIASFNSGKYLKFPPDGFSLRWYANFFRLQPFMDALALSFVPPSRRRSPSPRRSTTCATPGAGARRSAW